MSTKALNIIYQTTEARFIRHDAAVRLSKIRRTATIAPSTGELTKAERARLLLEMDNRSLVKRKKLDSLLSRDD